MNVVLVMFKDDKRRDFPLSEETAVLGRRQDCALRIPTRDVSRQHCELVQQGGQLTVKDLGSSNGTYVNGKRVAEAELHPGDHLKIGPVTFTVQIDGEPADIRPQKDAELTDVTPTPAGADFEDEETFDLREEDFELDDPLTELEKTQDDEDNPP